MKEETAQEILDLLQSIDQRLDQTVQTPGHVKIENINMPFMALVGLMVKVTLASIPAAIIVIFLATVLPSLLLMLARR